jgi:hypothetical protein
VPVAWIPWPVNAIGIANARLQPLDINMPKEKTFVTDNIQIDNSERLEVARISKQQQLNGRRTGAVD